MQPIENDEHSHIRKTIQPGLLGLMDGSVSTLAPLFAAAYATHSSHVTFLIGASAATGAAISMAFAEVVVGIELIAIAFIRYYYMKMNFILSMIQVVVGGVLVFLSGYLIGSA